MEGFGLDDGGGGGGGSGGGGVSGWGIWFSWGMSQVIKWGWVQGKGVSSSGEGVGTSGGEVVDPVGGLGVGDVSGDQVGVSSGDGSVRV